MAQLSGQGPILHSGATSIVDTSAIVKLGTRAVDVDGNVYVYVDFQESMIDGEWAVFDSAFAASQLTSTSKGWVGVVRATVSASDRFGYVQVYGVATETWVSSGSSAAGIPIVFATTDIGTISTEATTTASTVVHGVALAGSPDTCASSDAGIAGTSLAGHATVLLNWPFVTGAAAGISS
jgi:hypothetical protein